MEERDKLITGTFVEYQIERVLDSDDEEDEDGDDMQWLGYKEVSDVNGGKSLVSYEKPKLKTGELIDIVSRRPQKCRGPITLFKQWWQVTFLRTKVAKDKYKEPKDRYALCYRLRDDSRCASDNLVQLFISDVLNDQMTGNPSLFNTRNNFERYLREVNADKDVTLFNLQDHLEAFSERYSDPEAEPGQEQQGPEQQFVSAILGSTQFKNVKLGQTHPQLLHYLPQLFPFHFTTILGLKEERLDGLAECIEQDPGCLAFKAILAKRYNVLGVESSKDALIKSGLMSQVPKHEQDAIEIYEYMKRETKENGHTWITFDRIMTVLGKQVSLWEEAMEFLNKNKVTKTQIEAGHRIVFLYSLWKAENQIASGLNSLIRKHEKQPWNLEVDFSGEEFESILADNDQSRAARLISNEPVCAISGKGGCGKTYVVSLVLNHASANRSKVKPPEQKAKEDFDDDDDMTQKEEPADDPDKCPDTVNILLTAPTGKAANLLGKRANMTACTLHQVIYSYRMLGPGNKADWKHKDVNILVVDECSLVSVSTMAFLLELLLKNAKLRRVVLLGDIRQLPSIEPGNFLKDTFQSLEVLGYSVELRTNHRSESQAIVDNATAISLKQYPKFDNDKFIFRRLPENSNENNGNDYMLQDINEEIHKLLSHQALQCHVNSQFISFTRRVCEAVNDLCCKHYSNHRIKEHKKWVFRVGDKVCCTKNGYVNIYEEKHGLMSCTKESDEKTKEEAGGIDRTILTGTVNDTTMGDDGDKTLNPAEEAEKNKPKTKQIRLCNGEIFFITDEIERQTDQGKIRTFLGLSEDGDIENTFWVEKKQLKNACKLRHAWARTIHTFQGSETDHVIYIVGSRSWRQNWQHVYTAVTRGRKSVFIVGQESILRSAIRRSEIRRQTGLKKQLLQYFQKDKKLSPTHAVDSSILIPREWPRPDKVSKKLSNKLSNTATWLANCPKVTENRGPVMPSTSRGHVNHEDGYLNSTQDILSSLASEHDQIEEVMDDTCPPDNNSDSESQSLLAQTHQPVPSTSTDIRQYYKPAPKSVPRTVIKGRGTNNGKMEFKTNHQRTHNNVNSIAANHETENEEMIDEYISDEEGKLTKPEKMAIVDDQKGDDVDEVNNDSDADSVKSESLLASPSPKNNRVMSKSKDLVKDLESESRTAKAVCASSTTPSNAFTKLKLKSKDKKVRYKLGFTEDSCMDSKSSLLSHQSVHTSQTSAKSKLVPRDNEISPIVQNLPRNNNHRTVNKQGVTVSSHSTPASVDNSRSTVLSKGSPATPLLAYACHRSMTDHSHLKTSSPVLNTENKLESGEGTSISELDGLDIQRPGSNKSEGQGPGSYDSEIQAPRSNESMWSDADDSLYLNINDSQITANHSVTSFHEKNFTSGFSRNSIGVADISGNSLGFEVNNRQSLGFGSGESPINGDGAFQQKNMSTKNNHVNATPNINNHGNTSRRVSLNVTNDAKTSKDSPGNNTSKRLSLNVTNQSTCSQWSEVDDEQYITGLDLTDIENMATQKHPIDDKDSSRLEKSVLSSTTQRYPSFTEHIGKSSTKQYSSVLHDAEVTPPKSFIKYRQTDLGTPRDENDDEGIIPCTPLETGDHSFGIKRQLSWNQNDVSPMKRRLSALKFD